MELILTSQPKVGSILKIEYVDILDVVSIPDPDVDNNIDLDHITLADDVSWNSIEALPKTGSLELENVDTPQGEYELPKVVCSFNDTSDTTIKKIKEQTMGRYLLIVTTGTGERYLIGSLEKWMKMRYKLDTTKTRASTQLIDISFSFS